MQLILILLRVTMSGGDDRCGPTVDNASSASRANVPFKSRVINLYDSNGNKHNAHTRPLKVGGRNRILRRWMALPSPIDQQFTCRRRQLGSIRGKFHIYGIFTFSCHFPVILTSLWRQFGSILMSFQCHFSVILVSFWCHFRVILVTLWRQFGSIWMSFWCHFSLISVSF